MTRPASGGKPAGRVAGSKRVDYAADFKAARWYEIRPASTRKPSTYRCPLCGGHLPALQEHLLVLPEGDGSRRRHAHTKCVMSARKGGRLPLREEVEPRGPGFFARLFQRR